MYLVIVGKTGWTVICTEEGQAEKLKQEQIKEHKAHRLMFKQMSTRGATISR